jgi:hypothetical protein
MTVNEGLGLLKIASLCARAAIIFLLLAFTGKDDRAGPAGEYLQISQSYRDCILWPSLSGQFKSNGKNYFKHYLNTGRI